MGLNPTEPVPRWLRLWLMLAVAVFAYRFASGSVFIVLILLQGFFGNLAAHLDSTVVPGWIQSVRFVDDLATIIGVCGAVLAAKWQEEFFAAKSRRTCIIVAVIATILGLNVIGVSINPQLVPVTL